MQSVNALPLKIQHLNVAKKGNPILNDIDISIETSGVTIILGPNGAGKSLLLRTAHGLEEPSKGLVRWHKIVPHAQHSWRAYIFQKPVLLRRSVRANLEYVLSIHNVEKTDFNKHIQEALEHTGLSHLAERNARTLSGGEQQRLNIARAWVLKPSVMLLDEPTAELDPSGTAAIEQLIATITEQDTKIIMTTHDLGQAHRLAHDILFLHRGKVVEYSLVDEFFTNPKTKLAENFIAGKLLNGN